MFKFSSTVLLKIINSVLKMYPPFFLLLGLFSPFLCACETGIYHTVKPGQTLYRISRTYEVNENYLARVNGISDPSQLPIGTRLFIPRAERVLPVQVIKPTITSKAVTAPVAIPEKEKTAPSLRQQPTINKPTSAPVKPPAPKTKATKVEELQWPLRGKIVHSFSKEAKAGAGKGIEIGVRAGSDVAAAKAGKVIYSGDGVNGYAFLIILQHENDLFTVYGFNRENLVKQGDFVSQGETIALSGVPPSGGKPRLHFEVRKGKLAVDPILYLP